MGKNQLANTYRKGRNGIFPKEFLYKLSLGKLRKKTEFFIEENDLTFIRILGNSSILILCGLFLLLYLLLDVSVVLSVIISLVATMSYFFVLSDYVRSRIIERQAKFDELAFLIINSLSINMMSTDSLSKSMELLNSTNLADSYYRDYFQKIIFELNLGKSEEEIIEEDSHIFRSKKHRNAFQNLIKKEKFIESDPDFLMSVKKEIKLIEDNIVIFIAVSCLLPLVLSLVLSFLLPVNSPSLLILPLLYAIFGTLILRLIQNKSRGETDG